MKTKQEPKLNLAQRLATAWRFHAAVAAVCALALMGAVLCNNPAAACLSVTAATYAAMFAVALRQEEGGLP